MPTLHDLTRLKSGLLIRSVPVSAPKARLRNSYRDPTNPRSAIDYLDVR